MARWNTLGDRTRKASRGAALFAALTAGLAMGCPFERGLSCGDGWWDPDYEECDPKDPLSPHAEACHLRGFDDAVAKCDPNTCTILDSEADCNVCGDGVAADGEECDGNDFDGETCPNGDRALECTTDCKIDASACPQMCGDGVVSDFEECEPSLSCASNDDCPSRMVCYEPYGECVIAADNYAPLLTCTAYPSKVIGGADKPYASGVIERCTDECFFGRNNCGFCGDGVLDGGYTDLVYPGGQPVDFDPEVCDGDEADLDKLHHHCKPLCTDDALNGDVQIGCDFECNAGCTDFNDPVDLASPEGLGCCLLAGSPCVPNAEEAVDFPGVPNLPCCSWLEHPSWLADRRCVPRESDVVPVAWMCPD